MHERPVLLSRRQFLRHASGLGLSIGAALALASCDRQGLVARPAKVPLIGVLGNGAPSGPRFEAVWGVLRQRVKELGYVEGQDVVLEYRGAEEREGRYPELAAELIRLNPDVIVATSTTTAVAVKAATSTIPIVFFGAADPVGSGLVASLARPGGNVTGLSFFSLSVAGKQLELLKEVVPGLRRVAVLRYVANEGTPPIVATIQTAAPSLGLELQVLEVNEPDDFEGALAAAVNEGAGGVYDLALPLSLLQYERLHDLLVKHRLPTMHSLRDYVPSGGLMAYAANYFDLGQRAMSLADRIIKGAKPADLPVEEPTKFDFAINLKTAQAIGVTIPQSILLQATERVQ